MHEYSIVQALLERVETEASSIDARAVSRLHVRIGELAGVEVPLLVTAFDAFKARSIAEHADLVVETVPAVWLCSGCGRAFTRGQILRIDIAREVCGNAAATIAIGTCAAYGGLPAAAPNPTAALSVADAVPGLRNLINLPACPANAENLTALLVYYLTFERWPPLDRYRRPLFAYGKSIHDNCERRAHYDAGQYVETWGDAGHRQGYCLYKMGCKGPVAFQNCPNVGWNEGTNWPIGCGHPCLGCSEPRFWDKMTPFYQHLSGIPGFGLHSKVDEVGLWATAGVAAAFAAHGLVQLGRRQFKTAGDKRREEHHPPPEPPAERPSGPTPEGGAA